MPEHHPGNMGGTMRLGKRKTLFKTKDSILRKSTSRLMIQSPLVHVQINDSF